MPRATLGLLALVLIGCMPEGDLSSADSDQAARRGRGDGHSAPWHRPGKGHHRWGDPGHHDDHHGGGRGGTDVEDLYACLAACNDDDDHEDEDEDEDDDDDDCRHDHHHHGWRHGGNRADTPDECQALWDGLDDAERAAALDEAGEALAECGVEAGASSCESFAAEDDTFIFQFPTDADGLPLPPPPFLEFDVFAGDGFGSPDSVVPEEAGMVVATHSARVDAPSVELAADGAGVWSGPNRGDFAQFTYVACCVEASGNANTSVCDDAWVTLLAC